MNRCIDCGVELTPENRSVHQPTIRCLTCFDAFAVKTTAMFEDMAAQLDNRSKRSKR